MTNEADKILTYLRARDLPVTHKAADLIEQFQRERDEARARLAQAERDADIREDFAHDYGHDEGFRAGIEAAASRMWDIGCDETHVDDIRSLSPSDKPSAPSVTEDGWLRNEIAKIIAEDWADFVGVGPAELKTAYRILSALAARECD